MANELDIFYPTTGTFYAVIRRTSDGKVWNGSTFETWADGNIATYDVPLTSLGGDYYAADFPAAISAGDYRVFYFKQAGGTPATSDNAVDDEVIAWTGSGVVTPGSGAGTMTLTTAREWVRSAVEDGLDSTTYTNTDVDRAIYTAGEYFCRQTKCLRRSDVITIDASSNTLSLAGSPTTNGFRPERLIDCVLSGYKNPLTVTSYQQLNDALADDSNEGKPQALAFLDWTTARLWPVADQSYSAILTYWLAFTSWSFGTETPGSVTLNLPTDYLPRVLSEGAASVLTAGNKNDKFGTLAGERFLQYVESMKGAGHLAARAVYRNRLE